LTGEALEREYGQGGFLFYRTSKVKKRRRARTSFESDYAEMNNSHEHPKRRGGSRSSGENRMGEVHERRELTFGGMGSPRKGPTHLEGTIMEEGGRSPGKIRGGDDG